LIVGQPYNQKLFIGMKEDRRKYKAKVREPKKNGKGPRY